MRKKSTPPTASIAKSGQPNYGTKHIFHLRGNVAEWLSEDSRAAGGSWKNKLHQVLENDID